jgi:hypothetical protein
VDVRARTITTAVATRNPVAISVSVNTAVSTAGHPRCGRGCSGSRSSEAADGRSRQNGGAARGSVPDCLNRYGGEPDRPRRPERSPPTRTYRPRTCRGPGAGVLRPRRGRPRRACPGRGRPKRAPRKSWRAERTRGAPRGPARSQHGAGGCAAQQMSRTYALDRGQPRPGLGAGAGPTCSPSSRRRQRTGSWTDHSATRPGTTAAARTRRTPRRSRSE